MAIDPASMSSFKPRDRKNRKNRNGIAVWPENTNSLVKVQVPSRCEKIRSWRRMSTMPVGWPIGAGQRAAQLLELARRLAEQPFEGLEPLLEGVLLRDGHGSKIAHLAQNSRRREYCRIPP